MIDIRKDVAALFAIEKKVWSRANPPGSRNTFNANFDIALNWLVKSRYLKQSSIPNPGKSGKRIAVLTLLPKGLVSRDGRVPPKLDAKHERRDLSTEMARSSQRVGKGKVAAEDPKTWIAPRPRLRILTAEMKIIERIPTFEIEKLFNLWKENLRRLGDQGQKFKHAAASRIVKEVEKEWKRRLPSIRLNPEGFTWPTTKATQGYGGFDIGSAPDLGMLAYLDYRVGRTQGQPAGVRRAILDRVVEGTLPLYGGLSYYDQWGEPASGARLQKLAESLAAFTRNAKRRGKCRPKDAIAEWEADLDYLYKKYYLPRFAFGWPSLV